MFADRATIFIKSGKGGDGHVSFRAVTVQYLFIVKSMLRQAVLTAVTAAEAAI